MVKIYIHRGGKVIDATASSKVRSHSQFTQADYDYLNGKGWSDAEILKRWDEEASKGATPQKGNKSAKPGEPGYMSAFKDASNKFVTKTDFKLPVDPALGNRSGKILPSGTVVYKEGSGYRPWFITGSFRLDLPSSSLVSGTLDAGTELDKFLVQVKQANEHLTAASRSVAALSSLTDAGLKSQASELERK